MIWKNGLIRQQKKKNKERWHLWFAWRPVVLKITEDGHKVKVWLQWVKKKGKYHCWNFDADGWEYQYRLPIDKEE